MVNGNMLKLKDVGAYVKRKQEVRRIKRFWNWVKNEGEEPLLRRLYRSGELVRGRHNPKEFKRIRSRYR